MTRRTPLPPEVRRLFERPNIAHLTTLLPDGSPHSTPVWVDVDGDVILVNTRRGRIKERNVRRDPRVALSIHDRDDPLSAASVRGRVAEIVDDPDAEHIDSLSWKYDGRAFDGPRDRRVVLRIVPERMA